MADIGINDKVNSNDSKKQFKDLSNSISEINDNQKNFIQTNNKRSESINNQTSDI